MSGSSRYFNDIIDYLFVYLYNLNSGTEYLTYNTLHTHSISKNILFECGHAAIDKSHNTLLHKII